MVFAPLAPASPVRKTVLEYDDVMNTQRKVIYEQRRKVLDGENLKESVQSMLTTVIAGEVHGRLGEQKHLDAETWREVCAPFRGLFLRPDELKLTDSELEQYTPHASSDMLQERASDIYARKEAELGEPLMRELERVMMLRVVDEYWMDHIDAMQELRQGIGLRAYGQNDPVVEYKREGYEMFENMIAAIQAETIRRIFLARVQVGATSVKRERVAKVTGESAGSDGTVKKQPVKKGQKIGPNEPCPCGSGKKYKKCTCKTLPPEYHPNPVNTRLTPAGAGRSSGSAPAGGVIPLRGCVRAGAGRAFAGQRGPHAPVPPPVPSNRCH